MRAGHLQVCDGQIVWADEAAHRWLDYDAGSLVGERIFDLMDSLLADGAPDRTPAPTKTRDGLPPPHELVECVDVQFRTREGVLLPVNVCVEYMGHSSTLWSFVPRTRAAHDATGSALDPVTRLPRRIPSLGDLQATLRTHNGQKDFLLAVCCINVDGCRDFDNGIGSVGGEEVLFEVLSEVSRRLQAGVPPEASLACTGGGGFALLMSCDGPLECEARLASLLRRLAEPMHVLGHTVRLGVSIGVALSPWGEQPTDIMLQNAEHAVFFAKLAGGGQTHYFDAELAHEQQEEIKARQRFKLAVQRREFVLAYQPKVDMRLGKVVGVEALVRWQHPERGLLQPAAFIKLIEDDELIELLGDWVIGEAVRQAAEWFASGVVVSVSVNISARHLLKHDFIMRLIAHLAQFPGCPPGTLEIEILETSAIDDFAVVAHLIDAFKALGVTVTMDDFGTGYSSLTYLRQLPVDAVKLDQSFVRGVVEHSEDRAILEGVLLMLRGLGRRAIAEGVESQAHGQALLALGCTLGQGYGIARPMQPERLPSWIEAFEADPPWGRAAHSSGV